MWPYGLCGDWFAPHNGHMTTNTHPARRPSIGDSITWVGYDGTIYAGTVIGLPTDYDDDVATVAALADPIPHGVDLSGPDATWTFA